MQKVNQPLIGSTAEGTTEEMPCRKPPSTVFKILEKLSNLNQGEILKSQASFQTKTFLKIRLDLVKCFILIL